MNFINGITLLLIYQLVGEVTSLYLKLPVPGPVLGMLLLFLTLLIRKRSSASLDTASSALLSHLLLLFIPAGVGMIVHFELIIKQWIPISIALVVSTILSMAATALIMQGMNKLLGHGVQKDA